MNEKIIWNNNILTIENYKKVLDISNIKVVTLSYEIIGSDLHVTNMDKYTLIVVGNILEIRRKADEHI